LKVLKWLLERFAFEKNPFAVKMTKSTVLRIDITTLILPFSGMIATFQGGNPIKRLKIKLR